MQRRAAFAYFAGIMGDISFYIGKAGARAFCELFCEMLIDGVELAPEKGPFLLMANHISHLDPMLLGMNLPGTVDFMATRELLEIPVVGLLLKSWNAFSVDRQKVDRAAVRTALARLESGRPVGIFPERGIRSRHESVLGGAELAGGTAALWQMAGVPVVPAIILGTDQLYQWRYLFRKARIIVRYGPPLMPNRQESREAGAARIAAAWKALYDDAIVRYKIRPEELPTTAQERWRLK